MHDKDQILVYKHLIFTKAGGPLASVIAFRPQVQV